MRGVEMNEQITHLAAECMLYEELSPDDYQLAIEKFAARCTEQKDKEIERLNRNLKMLADILVDKDKEIAELKAYVEQLELHISLMKAGVKLP